MARYEISAGGSRFEITAPDDMPQDAVLAQFQQQTGGQPAKPEMGLGEYARRLGAEAVQGATFDFGDELGLVDREASKKFGEEHPVMSTVARLAGGIAPFVAGPGAAAARWAASGTRLLPRIGKSATLGGAIGTVSGLGAGEGDLADRMPSAYTGNLLGTALGAATPPVVGGISRLAGATLGPLVSAAGRGTQRAPHNLELPFSAFDNIDPATGRVVEGARFVNDMTPGNVAGTEMRGIDWINDTLRRAGSSPQELREALLQARQAARPYHVGQAPDRTAIADVSQPLQRGAGVLARRSTESAQDMSHFMEGRQTGMTPPGANQADLARRGIFTQGRLDEGMTGAQAQARFGTNLGAAQRDPVAGGLRGALREYFDRFFQIRDKHHHGFEVTGIETMEQAAQKADEIARTQLSAATARHSGANFRKEVDNAFSNAIKQAEASQSVRVTDALADAHRMFRPGKPINLEQFHNMRVDLDARIRGLMENSDTRHVGGILGKLRDDLVGAVDNATGGNASLYRQYRSAYREVMEDMEAYLAGQRAAKGEKNPVRKSGPLQDLDADENYYIREFQGYNALKDNSLLNPEKTIGAQRETLWRQGFSDGLLLKLPRNPKSADIKLLNEQRIRTLMREAAPTESINRVGGLGRDYIDLQMQMPETRHLATGNSTTAMRLQDDLVDIAAEAVNNVQTLGSILRGNTSLYQLGERAVMAVVDRVYSTGPDVARQATRYMFDANPANQDAIIRLMIERWGGDRMARFNHLMGQLTRQLGGPAAVVGGGVAAQPATPNQQGGPQFL